MSQYQNDLARCEAVYTSKGKAISKTARGKLDIIKRAEIAPNKHAAAEKVMTCENCQRSAIRATCRH